MFTGVIINKSMTEFNATSNETILTITWEPLINQFCEVLHYEITLSTSTCVLDSANVSASSMLIAEFPNISNNTDYIITIVAFNKEGMGSPASTFVTVTLPLPSGLLFEYKALHCFRNVIYKDIFIFAN